MSTQRRSGLVCTLVLVLASSLGGCADDAPRSPPVNGTAPSTRGVATGTAGVSGLAQKALADLEELQKQRNEHARGLLTSFESRVLDPMRDGNLEYGEATVAVRSLGKDATYRAVFDGSKPQDEQVAVAAVAEPEGLLPITLRHVRRWAIQSFRGASHGVAFHRPPTPLQLVRSNDGKNSIVWAQPFRDVGNVSYSFDERELIAIRGEWVGSKENEKSVTNFEWEPWHGRWLLRKASIHKGATTDYEYDDRDGVTLLRRALLRDGDNVIEAVFSYSAIRRRPN